MFNLAEYRTRPRRLIDRLPWAALIAPGVVLNKTGSFQRTYAFRGPDLESATEEVMAAAAAKINNALRRFGSGWALFAEARRERASCYPDAAWPSPAACLIDEERRHLFESSAAQHFESHYHLTLVYLPPREQLGRITLRFIEQTECRDAKTPFEDALAFFVRQTDRVHDILQGVLPVCRPLSDEETITYLHSTVSTKCHRLTVPATPMYLDAFIADEGFLTGLSPRLGDHYLRLATIGAFPGTSLPGILDALNGLALEYRWVSRFIGLDKRDAQTEILRYKKRWFAKRKGLAALLREVLTKQESVMEDSDARNKALDADAAYQAIADDLVAGGFYTATVVVWDRDAARAGEKIREVERTINSLGFTAVNETLNATEAWLGTHPGNCYANVRRPFLNTLNFAHLLPISAIWAGPAWNAHLDAPPLFYALTTGNTPFRFPTHIGDVGHFLVLGPTGAGKSVLLAVMAAQWLRYPEAQVYAFDKEYSMWVTTLACGGQHYDLGGDAAALAFQPLRHIDHEAERAWANEWLLELLAQQGLSFTPMLRKALWEALLSLATSPANERTLTGLLALIQSLEIKEALAFYTLTGPHGQLLDADSDTLGRGRWQCFEMHHLMQTKTAVAPVLSYLFHVLERRFTGTPTLLLLDEAWRYADHAVFEAKIREWLKTLRKANVAVGFVTQSIADALQSTIASAIVESCPTRIFLPNPRALEPEIRRWYEALKLNRRQIEILASATPKREYYYDSPLGNRLFELGLGEVALALCGSSTKEDLALARRLVAAECPEPFAAAFLRAKGIGWAADALADLADAGAP